jgi:hypothetical protein
LTLNPVVSNRAAETEIRTYFIQPGTDALQRLAGYKPRILPNNPNPIMFPPLHEDFLPHVDTMMSEFCGQKMSNCNPRVILLLGIWTSISDEFEHNLLRYKVEREELKGLLRVFRIMVDEPEDMASDITEMSEVEIIDAVKNSIDYIAGVAAHALQAACDGDGSFEAIYNEVLEEAKTAIQKQALQWAHLTGAEVLTACVPLAWKLYDEITKALSKYRDIPL